MPNITALINRHLKHKIKKVHNYRLSLKVLAAERYVTFSRWIFCIVHGTAKQTCESVTFWYGSRSSDPYHWLRYSALNVRHISFYALSLRVWGEGWSFPRIFAYDFLRKFFFILLPFTTKNINVHKIPLLFWNFFVFFYCCKFRKIYGNAEVLKNIFPVKLSVEIGRS